ncbi:MAG: hypothetical protein IJ644_00640 [Oscillospiraceae bacterium]|nr:hypothetical protein [Oscillospiraceae bacterium]
MIRKIIRIPIFLLTIFVLYLFIFYTILFFIPISHSRDSVRDYVLKEIPIGTSWNDTIKIVENNKKWNINYSTTEFGISIEPETKFTLIGDWSPNMEYIGEKSMKIYLGEYYAPLPPFLFIPTSNVVLAYLAFDKDDKLIEVGIQKEIDGP